METTAAKLQAIVTSKEEIRLAIMEKGIDVPPETPLADYAERILDIGVLHLDPLIYPEFVNGDEPEGEKILVTNVEELLAAKSAWNSSKVIYVQEGSYELTQAFQWNSGAKIYGGFKKGTNFDWSQRNPFENHTTMICATSSVSFGQNSFVNGLAFAQNSNIAISYTSNSELKYNIFYDLNSTETQQAAVNSSGASNAVLDSCVFYKCSGWIGSLYTQSGSYVTRNCIFYKCENLKTYRTAVYIRGGLFDGNKFFSCNCRAITTETNQGYDLTISNCIAVDCKASNNNDNGMLYIKGNRNNTTYVNNFLAVNCTMRDGGAIYAEDCNWIFANCSGYNCSGLSGVFYVRSNNSDGSKNRLINCVVFNAPGTSFFLSNNVNGIIDLIGCAASSNYGGGVSYANISGFLLFENDNEAPKFTAIGSFPDRGVQDYSREDLQAVAYGDWHIAVDSILKHSGVKTDETPVVDIEGTERNNPPSRGAYE